MDPEDFEKPLEDLVHELLKDQHGQVAREIRDKVQVLNGLTAAARALGLRVETEVAPDGSVLVRVFKEI